MNAPDRLHAANKPVFKWDDPLLLDLQLTTGFANRAAYTGFSRKGKG